MIDFKSSNTGIKPIIVKGIHRQKADGKIYRIFEEYLSKNNELKEFTSFLDNSMIVAGKTFIPKDLYFEKKLCTDDELALLINAYNSLVDSGNFYANNKKFNLDVIRNSTRNMLACGLLWRISDESHTWDICHTKFSGPGFSEMIKQHYLNEKAVRVNYIQFGENALYRFNEENPLNIDCEIFPKELSGKFDLKFTPRFGTGAMYITSRSTIAQKLTTKSAFGNDSSNWPKYLG